MFIENCWHQTGLPNCTCTQLPQWVVDIMEVLVDVPFDCSPILSRYIKATLMRCSSNSKPGVNGISYFHLQRPPCTHIFLALLYSMVLLHNHTTPPTWCIGKITLIHKDGPTSDPDNFQLIALASTPPMGRSTITSLFPALNPT